LPQTNKDWLKNDLMGYFKRIIYFNPVTLWGEHAGVTPSQLVKICSFIEGNFDIEQIIIDGQEAFGIPLNRKGYFEIQNQAYKKISLLIDEKTILALSLTSAQDIVSVIPILEKIKKKYNIPVIAGGYGISTCFKLLLKSFPSLFDCFVIGPGEFPLLEILKKSDRGYLIPEGVRGCAYLQDQKIIYLESSFTSPKINTYNWDYLNKKSFYSCLATSSSQYCNNKCNFCIEPSMNSKLIQISPNDYEKSLLTSLENFPQIKCLWITDPHIGGSLKNGIEILNILTNNNLKAFTNFRCDFDTSKIINKEKLKDFAFYFGLESANPETLFEMGKTRNPTKYLTSFLENISFCSKYKILPLIGLIINYPYENFNNTKISIKYIANNIPKSEFLTNGIVFSASLFMIHYGDLFHKKLTKLEKDGLLFESPFLDFDFIPEDLELVTKVCSRDFGFSQALSAIEEVQHMSVINANTVERLTSFGYFDRHKIKEEIKSDIVDFDTIRNASKLINYTN
jgi:hypothetical protein